MNACDNCGDEADDEDIIPLHEVKGLFQRIKPGGTVPAGECRKCGALTYPIKEAA
jgi:hypothetical protein